MGSLIYEFLADSFLFQEESLKNGFSGIPLREVQRELARYREFCIERRAELLEEAKNHNSSLALYGSERTSLAELTQAALYVQRYVVRDPLFRLTAKRSKTGMALTAAGVAPAPNDGVLNMADLVDVLRVMKYATPMVAADFLKFVPTSLTSEDTEGVPIYVSDNYFEDALPGDILRLFKDAAQATTLVPVENGHLRLAPLTPCRGISIRFKSGDENRVFIYNLHQIESYEDAPGDKKRGTMVLSLPDAPPDPEYFRVWVQQSINQAARILFAETYEDASVAAALNLAYSTHSELRFNALRKAVNFQDTVPIRTANAFLNLDLPILQDIDIERLMRVRRDDGEAFANFRVALDQKLAMLRDIEDPHQAKKKAAQAVRELSETQLQDVRLKMRSMREKIGFNLIVSAVAVAAAVQVHGFGLLAAVAAVPLGNSLIEYRKEVKRNPAFFLWKSLRRRAQR